MIIDRPECKYLDGKIVVRRLGSMPHSKAQERLLAFFSYLEQRSSLFAYPGVTLLLSPTGYRIADVAVFDGDFPEGMKYPTVPPEIACEVVSEDDRHVEIVEKLAEYHAWGVKHIWLVDAWTKKFFVYDSGGLRETTSLELPEFSARLSRDEIFGA